MSHRSLLHLEWGRDSHTETKKGVDLCLRHEPSCSTGSCVVGHSSVLFDKNKYIIEIVVPRTTININIIRAFFQLVALLGAKEQHLL